MRNYARRLVGVSMIVASLFIGVISIEPHLKGSTVQLQTALPSDAQHIPLNPEAPSDANLAAFRSKIQHIVFIIKENRSFDTYFGTFPGADGATTGLVSTGNAWRSVVRPIACRVTSVTTGRMPGARCTTAGWTSSISSRTAISATIF